MPEPSDIGQPAQQLQLMQEARHEESKRTNSPPRQSIEAGAPSTGDSGAKEQPKPQYGGLPPDTID